MSDSWNQGGATGQEGPYGSQPTPPPPPQPPYGGGPVPPSQPNYPQQGYPQQGYPQQGPAQPSYPQPSYPQQGGYMQPNPAAGGGYSNPGFSGKHPEGTKAILLSIFGLLCCWPLAIWSFIISKGARSDGTADGTINAAYIISIIAIALGVLGTVISLIGVATGSFDISGSTDTSW